MATHAQTADRCELCNERLTGARDRIGHVRRSHPRYARGLLMRMGAPLVFMGIVGVLALAKAPQIAFLIAFFVTFGMLFFGKQISRVERSRAGARRTLPIRRLAREGGLAVVILVPALVLIMIGLSRLR